MHIIFGRRSTALNNECVIEDTCKHCETDRHSIVGIVKYFHIFWIPVFAYSKKVIAMCHHCKHTREYQPHSLEMLKEVKSHIFTKGKMWKYYFILIAFLVLFVFTFIGMPATGQL